MKLIGIVGSNAEVSYNRLLIEFIAKQYKDLFEMEILEIKDVPLFNQDNDQTATPVIQNFNCKIEAADGVIIATPEHNHTITAALKSLLEWLSFKIHPLDNKPVMVVGASYYQQGSSRAQLHLRQILDAPGVNAYVFPGNEFLLGNVKEAFDQNGNIMDQGTVGFLRTCLEKFVRFVEIVGVMDEKEPASLPDEDLFATGKIDTTIEGIEMKAADWVEQAADKVKAAKDNDYVLLNRGVLTVNQLNVFLNSMPMELTFADANNQFIYYNYMLEDKDMLAKRRPEQVGNALAYCHPERARHGVEYVIQQLRSGNKDLVQMKAPNPDPNKFVVHSYQAMRNEAGHYMGVNEYIQDIMPIVNYYLQKTGQKLVGNPDATTGASETDTTAQPDATSGASETNTPIQPQVDVSTNASETTSTSGVRQTSYDTGQAQAQPIDNISGASEH